MQCCHLENLASDMTSVLCEPVEVHMLVSIPGYRPGFHPASSGLFILIPSEFPRLEETQLLTFISLHGLPIIREVNKWQKCAKDYRNLKAISLRPS